MNKKLLIPVLALAIVGTVSVVGMMGAENAYAETSSDSVPSIVQRIAERFGLNTGEVEGVFDEIRQEKHEGRAGMMEEKLNEAVSAGTITEEQKTAFLAKKEEMFQSKGDFQDLSWEEKHQQMQKMHDEFKSWAEETGIDLAGLDLGLGGRGHGGYGGHIKGCGQ